MVVESIKDCWLKVSSRIRDYLESPNQMSKIASNRQIASRHRHTAIRKSSSVMPQGYVKRKTPQGQVYFQGPAGQRTWYDPRVPRELLCTQLDLDALIGKLSSAWEIRYTPTGRIYYVNHKKKTTQFTDPRLVACRDYLLVLLKVSCLRHETHKLNNNSGPCKIDVNRKKIFEESFRIISQMHPNDLKRRLIVKFKGEEGLDYGGITREWFYLLSREMLNPNHGLFLYTGNDIYSLQINPDSGMVYREHLSYMNFCGRILGMAVFHGHFIDGRFILPLYKMLLGKSIVLNDIKYVDPELHRSLCWLLDNDITDVIDTTFLVQHNAFGQLQEHELVPNGANIPVTEQNKHKYVSLYVNYRCRRGIQAQFDALLRGFHELIPANLLESFNESELELLIGGLARLDVTDWKANTKLKNCNPDTPLVAWFWDIVESYSEDKRARLLQFVTGSSRVPIQGFKALQGVNSEPRLFTLHVLRNASTENLPKAHTCFNRLDLPMYESYDKLRDKLTQAIEETQVFAMQ